jgi:hypothetical protein
MIANRWISSATVLSTAVEVLLETGIFFSFVVVHAEDLEVEQL